VPTLKNIGLSLGFVSQENKETAKWQRRPKVQGVNLHLKTKALFQKKTKKWPPQPKI
jgi:hypothetical protein